MGGKLFLGRPFGVVGSSQHYSGMFKSSIRLVKTFCGSAGGSPAAHGRQQRSSLTKNELKSRDFDKIRPGVWRTHFRMQFQLGSYRTVHFVISKTFIGCSGGLRPHMRGSKTEHVFKNCKKRRKSLIFFSNNIRIKCVETFKILFLFILS